MRWVLWFFGHFNAKTPHQNTPFFALFRKKCKDGFRNKLNISALHFCILHFAMNGCADCSVASHLKKEKGLP
jgi:hypothetical protein